MKVLFAAGDVGGARALLAVIDCCEKASVSVLVARHGHIVREALGDWSWIDISEKMSDSEILITLRKHDIGMVVFASSVHDALPLKIARLASTIGCKILHVLDNWSNYRNRLEMDGAQMLAPDIYAVMDEVAFSEALEAGINSSSLVVTGQPALASLLGAYRQWLGDNLEEESFGSDGSSEKKLVVFISEPVTHDQGDSEKNPGFRGYTEDEVLALFCKLLQPYADVIKVGLVTHPREDKDNLVRVWQNNAGALEGGLLEVASGRDALFMADAVAGMASILLYEAWLLGKPVVSLQPNLRLQSLRMLKKRDGVFWVDDSCVAHYVISEWFDRIKEDNSISIRDDLAMHEKAPEKVTELVLQQVVSEGI